MSLRGRALLALLGIFALACLAATTVSIGDPYGASISTGGGANQTRSNIVVIVLDDWGIDQNPDYYASSTALIPQIRTLTATGIRYTNYATMPICSPSRASMLTGVYPRNHGVGFAIVPANPDQDDGLANSTPTVASVLRGRGYNTITIGKWHVSGASQVAAPATHAHSLGFTYFEGTVGVQPTSYTSYTWFEDTDSSSTKTTYNTVYTTDRAIAKIPPAGSFFMVVNYSAPHQPFHCPADALTPTYNATCDPIGGESANAARMHAALEAADVEVARLVAALSLTNTTVFIVGDNGTDSDVDLGYGASQGKGTTYLGGSRVPLIVFGNKVTTTGTSASVVNVTDLAQTILAIAGAPADTLPSATDSISFYTTLSGGAASPRSKSYSEIFTPTGLPAAPTSWDRNATNTQYSLVKLSTGVFELYDWNADPFEVTNLNDGSMTAGETAAYNALKAKIDAP